MLREYTFFISCFFRAAKIYFIRFKNRFLKIIFLIINMLKMTKR